MGEVNVRAAVLTDAPEMVAILNEIITIGGTTAYEMPRPPDAFDDLIKGRIARSCCHVAQAGGQVVGFQWVKPSIADPAEMGEIATFAKVGTVQRGIGTALFEATLRATRANGFTVLNATIRADNTGGLTYYSRMGFVDHSVSPAVPLGDGTPVDREHKRLTL